MVELVESPTLRCEPARRGAVLMPADVDAELFDKLSDAIDYVAQSGGGVVRVFGQTDTTTLYWKSLVDLAEKRGVKIEVVSV